MRVRVCVWQGNLFSLSSLSGFQSLCLSNSPGFVKTKFSWSSAVVAV